MSSHHAALPPLQNTPDGSSLAIGIVAARWHSDIVSGLLDGAIGTLLHCGVLPENIHTIRCPGSYEIPVVARQMARNGNIDAVITFGVVIRGETAHFEYVAGPVAYALQQVAMESGKPCIFGVLTVDTEQQAWDRTGGVAGHKGSEGALAAIETALALRAAAEIS